MTWKNLRATPERRSSSPWQIAMKHYVSGGMQLITPMARSCGQKSTHCETGLLFCFARNRRVIRSGTVSGFQHMTRPKPLRGSCRYAVPDEVSNEGYFTAGALTAYLKII